ncbi:MAG TPA: hypothetical protein PLT20_11545, partial [Sedimentisphaerales bacterium]|nr:hypothetical protein [Sedimentisphaerales bacterium]
SDSEGPLRIARCIKSSLRNPLRTAGNDTATAVSAKTRGKYREAQSRWTRQETEGREHTDAACGRASSVPSQLNPRSDSIPRAQLQFSVYDQQRRAYNLRRRIVRGIMKV